MKTSKTHTKQAPIIGSKSIYRLRPRLLAQSESHAIRVTPETYRVVERLQKKVHGPDERINVPSLSMLCRRALGLYETYVEGHCTTAESMASEWRILTAGKVSVPQVTKKNQERYDESIADYELARKAQSDPGTCRVTHEEESGEDE